MQTTEFTLDQLKLQIQISNMPGHQLFLLTHLKSLWVGQTHQEDLGQDT